MIKPIEDTLGYLIDVQRNHDIDHIMKACRYIGERLYGRASEDRVDVAVIASALFEAAGGHCTNAEVAVAVAKMTADRLERREASLATLFQKQFSSLALDAFFTTWNIIFDDLVLKSSNALDPCPITTLVGDLAFIKYIAYDDFKACLTLLLNHFCSVLHLDSIGSLIKKAGAAPDFPKDANFILACIKQLEDRCDQVFGVILPEETQAVKELLWELLFRPEYRPSQPISVVESPHSTKRPNASESPDLSASISSSWSASSEESDRYDRRRPFSSPTSSTSSSLPSIPMTPPTTPPTTPSDIKQPLPSVSSGRFPSQSKSKSKLKLKLKPRPKHDVDRPAVSRPQPRTPVDPLSGKRNCCQFSYGTSPPPEELPSPYVSCVNARPSFS